MHDVMTIDEIDAKVAGLKHDALRRSAEANETVHEAETAAYCALLTGLPSVDLDELMTLFDPLPLPTGFSHVVAIDLADGEEIGGLYWLEGGRPLTLHDVFWTVTDIHDEEIVEWSSTCRLPCSQPGLLKLGVSIKRQPRTSRPARWDRPHVSSATYSTKS